jgi:hypothetical protein
MMMRHIEYSPAPEKLQKEVADWKLHGFNSILVELPHFSDPDDETSTVQTDSPATVICQTTPILQTKTMGETKHKQDTRGFHYSRSISLADFNSLNDSLRKKFPTDESITVLEMLSGGGN